MEDGEEVKESPQLIENVSRGSPEVGQTLIPDLDVGANEPNYENMDNLTMLSTLNLQGQTVGEESDCLLPNLD